MKLEKAQWSRNKTQIKTEKLENNLAVLLILYLCITMFGALNMARLHERK
jgi:hypothetical protein